jgi:hypothetical protein
MINPMVRSAAAELIATQDEAIARYTAESASEMLEPEQRRTVTTKAAYQRNLRGAFTRVSEWPENFILLAAQPLQSFPVLGAPWTSRHSSPRAMTVAAMRGGAARILVGPSRVNRRSQL